MAGIVFESNGYKLCGNLYEPVAGNKDSAFLFIQGWTGDQNLDAARSVAALGYTTMTYDMRGNGSSAGNLSDFSRADFVHDAGVAYDYLRQRVGNTALIGVVGNSFGGYTSAMLTSEREISHLSLHVPANYPEKGSSMPQQAQMTPQRMEWRKKPLGHKQSKALSAIHNFKGKIQIIEAELDEIVDQQTPRNYANAVADKSQLTYEIVPGAPHELDTEYLRADYRSRLARWITENL